MTQPTSKRLLTEANAAATYATAASVAATYPTVAQLLGAQRAAAYSLNADKAAAPYVADAFTNRTSTTSLGTASVKGGGWTSTLGTWGTDANGAYLVTTAGDGHCVALIPASHARYRVTAEVLRGSASVDANISVQAADANNLINVAFSATSCTIYPRMSGNYNQLGSTYTFPNTWAIGTWKQVIVDVSGLAITVTIDGITAIDAEIDQSTPSLSENLLVGIGSHADSTTRFKNFTVDPLPEKEWKTVISTWKTADESLYLIGSNDDGATGRYLNSGVACYRPTQVSHGVRDPSIFWNARDGYWYVAHTYSGDSVIGSLQPQVGLARTRDLRGGQQYWQQIQGPNVSPLNSQQAWAPEWFVDTDGSIHLLVTVNLGTVGNASGSNSNWKVYCFHPNDPTNLARGWDAGTPLAGATWPSVMLDPSLVKVGATYHLFYANETNSPVALERAQSSSIHSGWTITNTGNWMGWPTAVEAPSVYQKQDGTWRCFADTYGSIGFMDSPDLNTWSSFTKTQGETNYRHCTVYKVPTSPAGLLAP